MGKYSASLIHEWFSDWHIAKCGEKAYLADQDRIWIETRYSKLVAVFDLKWRWAFDLKIDSTTYSEEILNNFFEDHGVPAYIVIIDPCRLKPTFEIQRPRLNFTIELTEEGFIEWINNNLDYQKLPKPMTKLVEAIE